MYLKKRDEKDLPSVKKTHECNNSRRKMACLMRPQLTETLPSNNFNKLPRTG